MNNGEKKVKLEGAKKVQQPPSKRITTAVSSVPNDPLQKKRKRQEDSSESLDQLVKKVKEDVTS